MCCGKGVVEVKCPYKYKDKSFKEASEESTFYLSCTAGGGFTLKNKHAYYYQVQLQMKVCEVDYCDFVVWRPGELVVLRISPNKSFIDSAVDKATTFYKSGVLPELIGKWYSRPQKVCVDSATSVTAPTCNNSNASSSVTALATSNTTEDKTDGNEKWCFCQMEERGTMIGCDNESCSISWYHIDSLNLQNIPSGKWYCPDCRLIFNNIIS